MRDLPLALKSFLRDIELVRVLCIALIMSYHIWFQKVSGGIDVFFVFTGYFTMLSMLHTIHENGRLSLSDIFLRAMQQLWIYAVFVASVIVASIYVYAPPASWESELRHFVHAGLLMENWQLVKDATDYAAFHTSASLFQHYWSLAIQWQYTMGIAIIMLGVTWFSRVCRLPLRRVTVVVVVLLATASFVYAWQSVIENAATAYFHTLSRSWELLLGALFALCVPLLRLKKHIARYAFSLGVICIVATGIALPQNAAFSSIASTLPVGGALLVLWGASSHIMISPPTHVVRFMSRYVYGLFLWHWPLLMALRINIGERAVTWKEGIVIIGLSFVLAIMSHHIITFCIVSPLKRARKTFAYSVVAAGMLAVGCVYVLGTQYIDYVKAAPVLMEPVDYPGAAVLRQEATANEGVPLMPPSIHVRYDVPSPFEDGACKASSPEVVTCSFGAKHADYTVALIGGSHSVHWFPALYALTEELNMRIDTYLYDGCRFTSNNFGGQMTDDCLAWNDNVIPMLQQHPPDFIFTTATLNKHEHVPIGYIEQWEKMNGFTHILAVTDNPRMPHDVPSCLEAHAADVTQCNVARSDVLPHVYPWDVTRGIPNNVTFIDMSDSFCDDTTCYATMGNIIMYRDNNHLTATYMETVAPALRQPLQQAFDQLTKRRTR